MSKIILTNCFELAPVGTYVFEITDVAYDESTGKLQYEMKTSSGHNHYEYFSLLDKNGQPNRGAYKAFSSFAKCVLDDKNLKEIDHEELVGKFIICELTHNEVPSRKDPNSTVMFEKLKYIAAASGFEKK